MQNVIQRALKKYFFRNKYKNLPSGWELSLPTPVCVTFELHLFASKFRRCLLDNFLTFDSSLALKQNSGYVPTQAQAFDIPLHDILSHKKSLYRNFWWRHCMTFALWPPSNQKSRLRLWSATTAVFSHSIFVLTLRYRELNDILTSTTESVA